MRLELKDKDFDVVFIQPEVIATEFTDVLNDPMLERSGSVPYKKLAESILKASCK